MINHRTITFDEPNHINKFLTHWVGRNKDNLMAFKILSIILKTAELKFTSFSSSPAGSEWNVSCTSVCFTDTPIEQSKDHCKRYGYFGVSFNKAQLIEYGAHPVLYLADNRTQNYDAFFNKYLGDNNKEKNLISFFRNIIQPYDSQKFSKDDWHEFDEREWRIIRNLPFDWISVAEDAQGPFCEYPFKGDFRSQQVSMDTVNPSFYLKFDPQIIENVIAPVEYKTETETLLHENGLHCELILLRD